MCTDDMATAHLHQPDPQVLHDFEPRVVFDLEPVDSVTVTMLMDNVTDAFMPDQGPARRPPLPVFHGGRRPATTMEGGDVPEVPLADGGFSVLVDVDMHRPPSIILKVLVPKLICGRFVVC